MLIDTMEDKKMIQYHKFTRQEEEIVMEPSLFIHDFMVIAYCETRNKYCRVHLKNSAKLGQVLWALSLSPDKLA